MSLQQGRVGVRSTVTFRYVGYFAGFCSLSGLFLRHFQRPNTASPAAAAGSRPARRDAASMRNASVARDERPELSGIADFLMALEPLA